MRVSTGMLFESGTRSMIERQSGLLRTQEQLSSGRRILAPSDDPVGTAEAMRLTQSRSQTQQYAANARTVGSALAATEIAIAGAAETLQSARETLVQARNASLTDADRRTLALDLRARFGEMLGSANASDGSGRYLFAGYSEDAPPFVDSGSAVSYVGDAGRRELAIGPARMLAVTSSGAALFEGIPVGNGSFTTAVVAGNSGNAAIGAGSVSNAAALTGHAYQVVFSGAAPATTYSIVDTTLGTTLSSGTPYVDGASVAFDGLQATLRGTPANGDRLAIGPPARQNVFAVLREAITLLETPATSAAAKGALDTGLERALASTDQSLDRLLAARTLQGAGQREAEAALGAQETLGLELDRQVSRIQDLDYAQAISDFTREQQALEAAQKAFKGTTQLSLFDLL